MSGGKSSKSGGSSFSYGTQTTTLPDWLDSASQQAVGMAQNIATTPYTPYAGHMVSDVPQDTLQAYQQIRNLQGQTNPAFATAQGIYGNLSQGAQLLTPEQQNALTNQLYGQYQQQVIDPTASLLGSYLGQGPATAQQVGANAMTLMQPYESAVIDPAVRLGQQALSQNLQQIGAGATQAGA